MMKRLRAAIYLKTATLHMPHNFWMLAAICTPLIWCFRQRSEKAKLLFSFLQKTN